MTLFYIYCPQRDAAVTGFPAVTAAEHCSTLCSPACNIQNPHKRKHQLRSMLQIITFTVNTHLWDYPVFPVGSLCFSHTLSPGSNVPWTVVCIALEHKLPLTLLAGKQSSKRHPICHSVQDLKQQRVQNWQSGEHNPHTEPDQTALLEREKSRWATASENKYVGGNVGSDKPQFSCLEIFLAILSLDTSHISSHTPYSLNKQKHFMWHVPLKERNLLPITQSETWLF